jgi:hypothetical protein
MEGDPDDVRVGELGPALRDDRQLTLGLVEHVANVGEVAHAVATQVGQHLVLDQPATAQLARA